MQSGGFHGRLLEPLIEVWLLLISNVPTLLAKIVFMPLGLTTAASAADTGFATSGTTTLITSNEEMKGLIKKASQRFFCIDKKSYSNNWKWNKRTKRQISCYVVMYINPSLLENMLAAKGMIRRGHDHSWTGCLIPSHPLTNFEIQRWT